MDLCDAIDRDPVALRDRERVVGRLELDVRADTIVAQMDARLQVLGAGYKAMSAASQPNGPRERSSDGIA